MSKKHPIFELDPEEQDLSDSFDRDEWKSVENLKEETAKAQHAAAKFLHKLHLNPRTHTPWHDQKLPS